MIHFSVEINLLPNASWYESAITVAGLANGTNGTSISELSHPIGVAISVYDVLYVGDSGNHRVVAVYLDHIAPTFIIDSGPNQLQYPLKACPTNSSLYIADAGYRIQKQLLNGSNLTIVLQSDGSFGVQYLYVDNNENIYFSNHMNHTVMLFDTNSSNITTVAGNGTNGTGDNQLTTPYGLFVDQNGTIYVADCHNHRIMKWYKGASSGICVAGNGTSGASLAQLNSPTDIVVDSNEYIYISESSNARITRWAPNSMFGVCIAACTGVLGTAPTQLNGPHSLAFDSYGSLYVGDYGNHRVQKFSILTYYSKHSRLDQYQ